MKGGLAGAAIAFALAGCVGGPAGTNDKGEAAYIGWQCESPGGAREWRCEQRAMRHGRPVSDTRPVDPSSNDRRAIDTPQPPPADYAPVSRSADWRRQLPVLDEGVEPARGATETPSVNRRRSHKPHRPAPTPQPAFGEWAEVPDKTPDLDASSRTPSLPRRVTGYTIQLGAFSAANRRERFVAEAGLDALDLQYRTLRSAGRNWWVVSVGEYPDRRQVLAAAEKLRADYPALETWVRPLAPLQQASGH